VTHETCEGTLVR